MLPGLLKITVTNVPAKPKRKGVNRFRRSKAKLATGVARRSSLHGLGTAAVTPPFLAGLRGVTLASISSSSGCT